VIQDNASSSSLCALSCGTRTDDELRDEQSKSFDGASCIHFDARSFVARESVRSGDCRYWRAQLRRSKWSEKVCDSPENQLSAQQIARDVPRPRPPFYVARHRNTSSNAMIPCAQIVISHANKRDLAAFDAAMSATAAPALAPTELRGRTTGVEFADRYCFTILTSGCSPFRLRLLYVRWTGARRRRSIRGCRLRARACCRKYLRNGGATNRGRNRLSLTGRFRSAAFRALKLCS